MAVQQLLDDEVLLRAGQQARSAGQRQDAFRFCAADEIKGVGGPRPGGRGAQAAVQACSEPVAQSVGGQASRSKDQDPLRVYAGSLDAMDGCLDQDGGFTGARRSGYQHGAGAPWYFYSGELVS
jgi:hypothetical protein